jgi:hypothetical protein
MPSSLKINDQFLQGSGDRGLPEVFTRACPDLWKLCGEGVFSWSVFRFYSARLLTPSGTFDPAKPFLLDLQYLRALTGPQIVSTSLDEIARLFDVSEKQRGDWSRALLDMIPNVVLGDRLIGWFVPEQTVRFFSATQSLGQIQDPDFVRMFSAIWLDERTRSPQLRLALLGPAQGLSAGQAPLVIGEVEA